LPPELTKETQQFFQNQPRLKALLELVFSPTDPKESDEDRTEFEQARAEFETLAAKARSVYEAHEARAVARFGRSPLRSAVAQPRTTPQATPTAGDARRVRGGSVDCVRVVGWWATGVVGHWGGDPSTPPLRPSPVSACT
jgi:hypothetical protein